MHLQVNLGHDPQSTLTVVAAESTVESLLPVQLDPKDYREYVASFFPTRKRGPSRGKKGGQTESRSGVTAEHKHYFMMVEHLATLSGFIGALRSHIRGIALDTELYDDATIARTASNKFSKLLIASNDQGTRAALIKNYIEIVQGKHVIRKSKTGFDVMFAGIPGPKPGTGTCLVHPVAVSSQFPEGKGSYAYQALVKAGAADKQAYKMALALGKLLVKELAGAEPTLASSMTRKYNALPLGFNATELMAKLQATANKFIPGIQLFGEVKPPIADKEMIAGISKYMRVLVVHEAERSSLDYLGRNGAPLTEETSTVNDESITLNADVGLSFMMVLPEAFAEYITQTSKGKEVPMVPLNTWVSTWTRAIIRQPRAKQKGGVRPATAPRYVLSASQSQVLVERRKAMGFFSEPGRSNDDGIFISDTGRFHWCPPAGDLALDNAKNYEALMEQALRLSYDAGTPLNASQQGETHRVFGANSPEYREKIKDIKTKISAYAGSLQTYSWDYNVILTSALSDPERLVSYNLSGTTIPNELSIADYLRKPFAKSMATLFNSSFSQDEAGNKSALMDEASFGKGGAATTMLRSTPFSNLFRLYQYLLKEKKVPVVQDLILEAAKALKLTTTKDNEYEEGLYQKVMDDTLNIKPEFNKIETAEDVEMQTRALQFLLFSALRDSSGAPGTNLAKAALKNGGDVKDEPHYFHPEFFTLAEFNHVYQYIGGMVFQRMCEHVQKVPKKVFFVLDPNNPVKLPEFQSLVKEVMPLVTILGKYTKDAEEIYKKAEVLEEHNKSNPSLGIEDLQVPGSKKGFQLFPHQLRVEQSLMNHPRYAVLDVAPGGGKTLSLLSDIAMVIGKKLIKGPAVVLAPNNLVRNWVEDMHKVTEGRWNLIPITTSAYRTWGDERLTEMIKKAPRNTIVILSIEVLRLDKYPIVIGNHVENVSAVLEFARKFGFEYVALDESHRCKNVHTRVHKAVRQLMVASTVKFVRIATGTLIQDRLTDVIGQAALFNPQIFLSKEDYEAEHGETLGNQTLIPWKKGVPKLAREQLSKHCAVISVKRKEWAFMLPRPIETFMAVALEKPDAEGGQAHQLMYDAILKETLEEIKQNTEIMSLLQGKGDEDEDDEDQDDAEAAAILSGDGSDLDEATMSELEAKLHPYLQRLERIMTDPLGDPFGEVYFKGISRDDFVSNKVLKIIERIKLNFVDMPWTKGKRYKLKELVDFGDMRYVLMGPPGEKLNMQSYDAEYESNISPDKDPRWKPEPRGKVLVFCKYIRSVNAIMRALPPELKKVARAFHGEVGQSKKMDSLEEFKSSAWDKSKGAQILIAQEDAIKEGHNLQMASRLIRVESPWSPGDLDQAQSRIFRPDPTGKFSRENVYLDWVLANGTMEVAKMGRLISKMVTKAQFDEAENKLYDSLNEVQLPPIKMSLTTIASVPLLSDIAEYIDTYKQLVYIQASEFEEMRQSGPSKMLDVDPIEMFPDARIIEQVPYIPDLIIPDRHNFGLMRVTDFMQDVDDPEVVEVLTDPKSLIGTYVHTEFGNGVIKNVRLTPLPRNIDPSPEMLKARKITSIEVTLANGDEYGAPPSLIYFATNVTEANVKSFSPTTKLATERDKEIAKKAKATQDRKEKRTNVRQGIEETEIEAIEKSRGESPTRKANAKPTRKEETEASHNLELFPVVYNGYLAVEGNPEDPAQLDLSPYGFKDFGDYAYVMIKDYTSFTALLEYLESRFALSPQTIKRLDVLHDSFQTGRGSKFAVELAPISDFKNFYTLSHRMSGKDKKTGKYELKVYPVIINRMLMLNVDISTNPIIKRYIGKQIPGTRNLKFAQATGLHIKFFNNRRDVVSAVKDMRADGLIVTNLEEFKTEFTEIKTVQHALPK